MERVGADRAGVRAARLIRQQPPSAPAEADDRAVPGHREGDLIIGKNIASAIGTLVRADYRLAATPVLPERHRPSLHSAIDLDWVATELNDRPRKGLGFAKPIEEIGPPLLR